jgi:hypothetical protein
MSSSVTDFIWQYLLRCRRVYQRCVRQDSQQLARLRVQDRNNLVPHQGNNLAFQSHNSLAPRLLH